VVNPLGSPGSLGGFGGSDGFPCVHGPIVSLWEGGGCPQEPAAVPRPGRNPAAPAPAGTGIAQPGAGAFCAHTGPCAGAASHGGQMPALCQPQARLSCSGLCQGLSCDPPELSPPHPAPRLCPGLPSPGPPCPASRLRAAAPAEAGIAPALEQRWLCVGLSQAAEAPKAVAPRGQLLPAHPAPSRHCHQQLCPTRWPCSPPLASLQPLHRELGWGPPSVPAPCPSCCWEGWVELGRRTVPGNPPHAADPALRSERKLPPAWAA